MVLLICVILRILDEVVFMDCFVRNVKRKRVSVLFFGFF